MSMHTKNIIVQDNGQQFEVGDRVNINYKSGMGIGGAQISKITETGFYYRDGKKRVRYEDLESLSLYCRKGDID